MYHYVDWLPEEPRPLPGRPHRQPDGLRGTARVPQGERLHHHDHDGPLVDARPGRCAAGEAGEPELRRRHRRPVPLRLQDPEEARHGRHVLRLAEPGRPWRLHHAGDAEGDGRRRHGHPVPRGRSHEHAHSGPAVPDVHLTPPAVRVDGQGHPPLRVPRRRVQHGVLHAPGGLRLPLGVRQRGRRSGAAPRPAGSSTLSRMRVRGQQGVAALLSALAQ